MNKNGKFLFVGLTLLLLCISIGAISAADINDTTTTSLSDNTADNTNDIISSGKVIKTSEDVKTTNKNPTKKTKQADKQTKKEQTTEVYTVDNYETLKTSWNNIQENGNNETQYTLNIKNGKYNFEEELKAKPSNETRYITLNGEDVTKTIFDGQNKTRLFNLNNINQVIIFNNITFINGFNNSQGGAILANSTLKLNNTCFINNSLLNEEAAQGGALKVYGNLSIYNSEFINNSVTTKASYAYGGAIYACNDSIFYNCSFINNQVIDDEAILMHESGNGGAIYILGGAITPFNIVLCEFRNNKANSSLINSNKGLGGAICVNGYYINIENCEFYNNTANYGGAIKIVDSGYGNTINPNILACVFANNTAIGKYQNIYAKEDSNRKLNLGSIYYADNSESSIFDFSSNGKKVNPIFNQKTKNITINCITKSDSYYGTLKNLGRGKSLQLKSSSNLINTTGITFNPENKYQIVIDTSKLPANHENITLTVEGMEVAKIVWDYTNVEFNNITAKPGNTITLKSTFKTSDNKYIPNGKVAFKINGCTIGHSNIRFGTATLNYTIPDNYSAKDYILTTTYGGNSKFIEARMNSTLHLEKLATKTNLTTSIDGNTLKITVDPKDENGNIVKDGKICVKIEGKTLQTLKITGKTIVNFTIPKSWNNREIKVLAIYGENNNHKESRMEIKTKLILPNTKTTKTDTTVNNYYVSANNGSDSNTGTQNNPFKTIQKAITTVNNDKQQANIYLDGNFKGVGNTNLTIPGDLHINFIGVGNSSIDGEVNYTYNTGGGFYWGSSKVWEPYFNGTGNWAMNITKGNGLITISNFTIKNCWNVGGSDISFYKTATVDNYGNLAINNVSFIYNHGGVGASIRNNNGSNLNVTNSLFEANRKSSSTGNYGAGIYNNGTATIINSTFQKNYARWGTITNDKQLTIINSTIRDNIAYDGASAYKTGSGITINTGSTTYGVTLNITDITTEIEGCIFINNDQLDIYSDLGRTNITNNVFNKSTGVVFKQGNNNIVINIKNNTFNSPIGSSLYTSLSSKNQYIITLKLDGTYKFNIDSNRVLNVTGTTSKALELTANNSNIINNHFTRIININGNNNTLKCNNITTSTDNYAIDIKDYVNNTIVENYLESKILKGNSAVNYTSTTNKVENNTPEVQEIQVNDETFFKFFDDDGNLLDSYKNIEQIQVIGSLNNKNMNFNNKISLVQKSKFTSYNVTIKTTTDIELLSFTIINTNNEPILTAVNNSLVKENYLQTNNNHTVILSGENNTIKNNTLLADVLVGDGAVKTDKTNNITQNIPTYKNNILSQDNFNTYFNNDGTIKLDINDIHFLIDGIIENKNIILSNNRNVTITNYHNAKLVNTTIKSVDNSVLNMSYITIENTINKTAIQLGMGDHKINNCNITTNYNIIDITNTTNLELTYNNIKTTPVTNSILINIKDLKNKAQIYRNNITIEPTSDNINSTVIKSVNQIKPFIDMEYNNIIINSNNVNIINIKTSNTTIEFNNITSNGNNVIGVKLSEVMIFNYKLVGYNNIIINGKNSVGIIVSNNTLRNKVSYEINEICYNDICINNTNSTGIIINSNTNTSISFNNMTIYGDSSNALIVNNSNYTKIFNNTIESFVSKGNVAPIIVDNSTQTYITDNSISTTGEYSIIVNKTSSNTRIQNNILYSQYLGDNSVLNLNMGNNEVIYNSPEELTYFQLNDETYHEYFDENGNLYSDVPSGIIILATGSLHDKILNINKPISIIGYKIKYVNTTLNITADNTNITGILFEDYTKINVDANNCNLDIESIDIKTQDSQTLFRVNGNNNTITVGNINSKANNNNTKINLTIFNITGNNNIEANGTITTTGYDHSTLAILNNVNNSQFRHDKELTMIGNNITSMIINNSNNNIIFIKNANLEGIRDNKAIILTNSSYNNLTGRFYPETKTTEGLLILRNNSNHNIINELNITSNMSNTDVTPIQIINSHYNKIIGGTYNFPNLIGWAIKITESVENNITYNILTTGSLSGNDTVIQENQNETINNIVEYNYQKRGIITIISQLTTTGTLKTYNTITINARSTRNAGHILFMVNGKEIGTVNVVSSRASINYTIQPTDGEKIFIKAILEDPTLKYARALRNTTINLTKLDTNMIMANITNKATTSTITTLIMDEYGNIIYDGNVTFKLGNINQTVAIRNGIAQATFDTSAYKPGKYNIIATFNGNNICNNVENIATLTVTPYNVNVVVDPITTLSGNKVLLTANVTDVNGNKVNSGRVIFKLNGCTLKDEKGNTLYANVINGTATVEYMIPAHYTAKDYTLTAVASSSSYNRTESNSTLTINKTTPKALVVPTTVKRTNNTTITVKFTDDENNDLIGENKVCIKFNGKTLINTKATNGTVNVNLDLTNYKNSQYELTVICGANSRYNTCKNVSTLILE